MISDKITVDLYNKKDSDIKISELAGMLKKVKGKSGTIDMKYFSEDHKIAVFQPKRVEKLSKEGIIKLVYRI